MSRQAITNHYTRLLARWPLDRLRPEERHFQRILEKRIQAAPRSDGTYARNESDEVNAAYLLLENSFGKRYPLSENMMKPASDPGYYGRLEKELLEAPDRSWFGRFMKRLGGIVRFN